MNTHSQKKSSTFLVTALAAAISSSAVMAQSDAGQSSFSLEEIIVTATKRETSLMDTSAAVSAFDGDTRQQLGIDNSFDLVAHTPSLSVTSNKISIRGIGRANNALGSDPGVGIYWDGVYMTENGVFDYSNFLDIERIEVLRGPQGTLYGRNSIGGAVNFVSKQPTDEWSGNVVAEFGDYDRTVLQGLISGPLTDKLGVMAAVSEIKRDGFQEDIRTGDDCDQTDNRYATVSFRHETTDNWTNSVKLLNAKEDYRPSAGYAVGSFSRDLVQQYNNGFYLPGMFPDQNFVNMNQGLAIDNPALDDIEDVSIDFKPIQENDRKSIFVTSEYDADRYSIKYTGGYTSFDYIKAIDADLTNAADSGVNWDNLLVFGLPGGNPLGDAVSSPFAQLYGAPGHSLTPSDMIYTVEQEASFVSHELQLTTDFEGPVNYIGGLYYYRSQEEQQLSYVERNDDLMDVYRWLGVYAQGFAGTLNTSPDNDLYRASSSLTTQSMAVYGQLQWELSESTVITAGLRYSYDEKDGRDETFAQYVGPVAAAFTNDGATVSRQADDDWKQVTWRLGIDHALNEDHFLYAFVASGYRSGGFNFNKPTSTTDVDQVDPEELTSFEIGYKGELMDNRVNFSSAIYYYDYEDLQVLQSDVVSGVAVTSFENAKKASAWGIETEMVALLTENLSLRGTWSYNDTEYKDFASADANACIIEETACVVKNLQGNEFPLAPKHKASINLTYEWEMADLEWRATASYMFTGEQYMSAFNNDSYDKIDSWDRADARLSVNSADQSWEVTAFVKNISDDRDVVYQERPSTVTRTGTKDLTEPRTLGVRVRYSF
mgnify:CR=1 FL=1